MGCWCAAGFCRGLPLASALSAVAVLALLAAHGRSPPSAPRKFSAGVVHGLPRGGGPSSSDARAPIAMQAGRRSKKTLLEYLDTRNVRMNPNNGAYWRNLGLPAMPTWWTRLTSVKDVIMNPNNVVYWLSRGQPAKPTDWWQATQGFAKKALQVASNFCKFAGKFWRLVSHQAAPRSKEKEDAICRDHARVELAAKAALGPDTQVIIVGSRGKQVATEDSDLDLMVRAGRVLTGADREALGRALVKEFGQDRVLPRTFPPTHKLHGDSGIVEVLPEKADYLPKSFEWDLLDNSFDAKWQEGVLAVKHVAMDVGESLRGVDVEAAVRLVQRLHPTVAAQGLALLAWMQLCQRGSVANCCLMLGGGGLSWPEGCWA